MVLGVGEAVGADAEVEEGDDWGCCVVCGCGRVSGLGGVEDEDERCEWAGGRRDRTRRRRRLRRDTMVSTMICAKSGCYRARMKSLHT